MSTCYLANLLLTGMFTSLFFQRLKTFYVESNQDQLSATTQKVYIICTTQEEFHSDCADSNITVLTAAALGQW